MKWALMRTAVDWLKEEKKKNEQNLLHKNAQIDFPAFSISLMICLVLRNNGCVHHSFVTIVFGKMINILSLQPKYISIKLRLEIIYQYSGTMTNFTFFVSCVKKDFSFLKNIVNIFLQNDNFEQWGICKNGNIPLWNSLSL